MTWYNPTDGYHYKRRANGWPYDSKAPDGFTVAGWRKVDGKRRVRWDRCHMTHPDLQPGEWVRIHYREWPSPIVACQGLPGTTPENLLEEQDGERPRFNAFYDSQRELILE